MDTTLIIFISGTQYFQWKTQQRFPRVFMWIYYQLEPIIGKCERNVGYGREEQTKVLVTTFLSLGAWVFLYDYNKKNKPRHSSDKSNKVDQQIEIKK